MNWFKHEINNKKYRRAIYGFLIYHEETESLCYAITNVTVYKYGICGEIAVKIETYRPGLLIGKGGQLINRLQAFIEQKTKQKIKMEISECKLWQRLYN